MRTILFLLVSITFILSGCKSQTSQMKEVQLAEDELSSHKAIEALVNHEFVLEADRVKIDANQYRHVSTTTNFISMNKHNATIQLGLSLVYNGPNGMGGITLDGQVSNVKMNKDKKGNVNFSMNVFGPEVSVIVDIMMIAGTNKCSVIVIPNSGTGRTVTFLGYLLPKSESRVFKGRTV